MKFGRAPPQGPPDRFAPLETWEAFLRELESLPSDRPLRAQLIRRTRSIIAAMRRAEKRAKDQPVVWLIDPPIFASVARWQRFLESMERAPPNMVSRNEMIRRARQTIADLTAQGDPYAEAERRGTWLRRARDAADRCLERPRMASSPPGVDPLGGLLLGTPGRRRPH